MYFCTRFITFFSNIFTAENRKILHEQEAEKMLIHLLSHDSADVQTAAAQALAIMAENLISRDSVREWGNVKYTVDYNKTTNTTLSFSSLNLMETSPCANKQ